MKKEEFLNNVSVIPNYNVWMATLEHKGMEHTAWGSTELEAKENLWEYLVSDICIF